MPPSKSSAILAAAPHSGKGAANGASASSSSAMGTPHELLNAGYVPVRQLMGKVVALWGEALLRVEHGDVRPLKVGDVVKKGDVVLTSQNGIVQIEGARRFADPKRVTPEKAPAVDALDGDDESDLLPGIRVERISESVTRGGGIAELAALEAPPGVQAAAVEPDSAANPDVVTFSENGVATFDPRINDSFAAGNVVLQSVAGQPITVGHSVVLPQGTLTMNQDGTLTFAPVPDFTGVLAVPYVAIGGDGKQGISVITIVVTPVNDAPLATDDRASVAEDAPITLNLLDNDSDPDGDVLTITAIDGHAVTVGLPVSVGNGSGHVVGNVTLNSDGTVTFNPAPNYFGPVEFDYTVSDGHGGGDTAHVRIDVGSVDDLPMASNDAFVVTEGAILSGSVAGNDTLSGDGGNVFAPAGGPSSGALVFNATC